MKHAYKTGLTCGRAGVKSYDYSLSKSLLLRNIAALCKKNGVSIARLEKDAGIGNGTIARWGESSPRVDSAKKVADYFGVTVDELLSDTDQDTA